MNSFITKAIAVCMLVPAVSFAQTEHWCGTAQRNQKLLQENPELQQYHNQLEDYTRQFIESNTAEGRTSSYVIPVVFHIVHQYGLENISDAQVLDQMRILNEDYNKRNADTAGIIPLFRPLIADVGIEFRLAKIDPWGKCTNGIDRIASSQTNNGNDFSKLNNWPREKYLNIWVVRTMEDGVAGYAYLPGSMQLVYVNPARDGIIILHNYIGSIGTSNPNRSRALTHEIGHYLNLNHTWGPTNAPGIACGDDNVGDTPETRGSTNCNLNLAFCNAPAIENVQNFMDYSYCSAQMYTEGQKLRMLAALNAPVAQRNNLWSEANLIATGVADNTVQACAPKADFAASKRLVCLGDPVTFKDASFNGSVNSRLWTFQGADLINAVDSVVTVTFQSTGWQTVTLDVSNQYGADTKTDAVAVYVTSPDAVAQYNFFEGFEDPGAVAFNWASFNYDNNTSKWQPVNFTGYESNNCMMLNNYQSPQGDVDDLISPAFDLSNNPGVGKPLRFRYSWASFNPNYNEVDEDTIRIFASSNCGASWVQVYARGGGSMVNAGYQQAYWVPGQSNYFWRPVTVNLPAVINQQSVRFRFQVRGTYLGNNFYLDDVNINNSVLDINTLEDEGNMEVTIVPNPASSNAILSVESGGNKNVAIAIYDMLGAHVADVYTGVMNTGENVYQLPVSKLSNTGMYLVRIQSGNTAVYKKLMYAAQ